VQLTPTRRRDLARAQALTAASVAVELVLPQHLRIEA